MVTTSRQSGRLPWINPPQGFAKFIVDGAIARNGNRDAIAAKDGNG